MNPRGRPKQDPTIRRHQILDAAQVVFSERGYHDADLQAVADAAGVAKGTLYLYFDTKQDLFQAAVERSVERLATVIDQEVTRAPDPPAKIRALITAYMRFFAEDAHLAEVVARERGQLRQHAEVSYFRIFERNRDRLAAIFREGITRGDFRTLDVDAATAALASLLAGTIFTWMFHNGAPGPADAVLADLVLEGIRARE